ncbi:MAG: hypothetical protein ACFCVK_09335 [Acidimicrobiales bacterium]
MTANDPTNTYIEGMEATRHDLLALRAGLLDLRRRAPTPGVAHALRLADTYLFMALGYTGHRDELFPEEGFADLGGEQLPNLR